MRCLGKHLQITLHWDAEEGQEGRAYPNSSATDVKWSKLIALWHTALNATRIKKHAPYCSGIPDFLHVYAALAPPSFWLSLSPAFFLHADVWKAFILVIQKELFCINYIWELILASLWGKKEKSQGSAPAAFELLRYLSSIRPKSSKHKNPILKIIFFRVIAQHRQSSWWI